MASPHNFSVALLLRLLVGPRAELPDENEPSLSLETVERLAKWLVAEVSSTAHVIASLKRTRYGVLLNRLETHVGGNVSEWLRDKLDACRASPDAVVDALDELRHCLEPSKTSPFDDAAVEDHRTVRRIDPKSVFGLYLRRTLVGCNWNHFDGLSRLFDHLNLYVDDRMQDEDLVDFLAPHQLELYLECVGRRDAELRSRRLARRSTSPMRRQAAESISRSIGRGATFESTSAELSSLLSLHSELPRAHFLQYLNCSQHRELQQGLDSLHRYFDYALSSGGASGRGGRQGRRRATIQHAVLNVAALHFRFGHHELAAVAIDEAVRVAQQRRDHGCVTYALSWLHHVMVLNRDDSRDADDVLRRCAERSQDLGLADLGVAARLATAGRAAFHGDAPQSARAHELMAHPVVARYQPRTTDATLAADACLRSAAAGLHGAAATNAPGARNGAAQAPAAAGAAGARSAAKDAADFDS